MGPNQTLKLLQSKQNHKLNKQTNLMDCPGSPVKIFPSHAGTVGLIAG